MSARGVRHWQMSKYCNIKCGGLGEVGRTEDAEQVKTGQLSTETC